MISSSSFDEFMYVYRYYDRSVLAQELNLSSIQVTALHRFLETNLLPQNKYYKYDFFYDNCATRIRDVMEQLPETRLYFEKHLLGKDSTMREMLDPYVWHMTWVRYGFYLALGTNTEEKANYYLRMFLPNKLSAAFSKAKIMQSGKMIPLVKSTKQVFEGKSVNNQVTGFFRPTVVNWMFFVFFLIITFTEVFKEKYFHLLDTFFFLLLGVFGLFLFLLWFATDHQSTQYNWNVLWALPLHLLFVLWFRSERFKTFRIVFYSISALFCLFILGTWGVFEQKFHPAIVPILLIIIMRSVRIVYRLRYGK
jgi:hypothetical protein